VGLAGSVALIGVAPALAGTAAAPVGTSGPASVLSGGLAPGTGPVDAAGGYPETPDGSWPRTTTPEQRFTVTSGGLVLTVACLDLCGPIVPGDYSTDSTGTEIPSVTGILTAAQEASSALAEPDEAAAVQSAIWYVTAGFVLDADTDQAIRRRATDLVASATAPVSPGGPAGVGTVLVAEDPNQPRLVVTHAGALSAAADSGPDRQEAGVFALADEAPTGTDTATTTATSTTSGPPTATPSGTSTSASTSPSTSPITSSTGSTAGASATVRYANCTAVWVAIGRPLHAGEPGYNFDLDRDRDGIACEVDPRSTDPTSSSTAATTTTTAVGGGSGSSGVGSDGSLPSTGFALSPMLAAGGALILLGGSILIRTRARRPEPAPRHGP
jgi:hypothetical protein